jgi:hypothetical protein
LRNESLHNVYLKKWPAVNQQPRTTLGEFSSDFLCGLFCRCRIFH